MKKLDALRKQFSELGIDALLVTNPYNRRYLSNFTGTSGACLITEKDAYFITDFRYVEQAKNQAQGYTLVRQEGDLIREAGRLCREKKIGRLGFEEKDVTFHTYRQLQEAIPSTLVPVSGAVEKLRLIKTPDEINILKVACDIADSAFHHILEWIRPGVSERDVANELEMFMRKAGATSTSFDTIVASGKRSALPHGVATDKIIEKGDMVTLDFGAYYQGYCSDMTRTIAVGEPPAELKNIYHIVYEAQRIGVESIKRGMTGKEADAVCRDYISEKGYGDLFGHSTGHGIGLEIHEGPTLSFRSDTVLEPGMVVTVEPGIYIPGLGGVRIEDDLLITEAESEVLTHSTKELIIL
jgi:Metallopeptidase family M24./Creatinase/Prolidase N-terminal domain.